MIQIAEDYGKHWTLFVATKSGPTESNDEQVLQQQITSLGLPQSADAANYIAFDESAPTTEVLEKGWENDLLDEFVLERNQESSNKNSLLTRQQQMSFGLRLS